MLPFKTFHFWSVSYIYLSICVASNIRWHFYIHLALQCPVFSSLCTKTNFNIPQILLAFSNLAQYEILASRVEVQLMVYRSSQELMFLLWPTALFWLFFCDFSELQRRPRRQNRQPRSQLLLRQRYVFFFCLIENVQLFILVISHYTWFKWF